MATKRPSPVASRGSWRTFRARRLPTRPRGRQLELEALEERTLLTAGPLGGETLVNTYTPGDQSLLFESKLSAAADTAGNSVVVWTSFDQDDGLSRGVYAQQFDSAGQALGEEIQVNTVVENDQSGPAVAMTPEGDFVIVWRSVGQEVDAGPDSEGIFARLFTADGTPRGPEFQVNTIVDNSNRVPTVAVDDLGNLIVTWQSAWLDGDGWGIFARRFAADGTPLDEEEFQVNAVADGDQTNPVVAADATGNFVVVWQSAGQDGDGAGIFGRRFAASGNALDDEDFQVNTLADGAQELPSVAMDSAGDFLVVWQGPEPNANDDGILARRYSADGVAQGPEFVVNGAPGYYQWYAAVDMDSAGRAVVTWSSYFQDEDDWGVYAQQLDEFGQPLGSEFQVNTSTDGEQANSSVTLAGAGERFLVAWSGAGLDDDSDSGVFAQWYEADDFGDNFDQAYALTLDADSSASVTGALQSLEDEDFFSFVASFTGTAVVTQQATPGSSLDSYLYAYNAAGTEIISSDGDPPDYLDSTITFTVSAGATYYLRADNYQDLDTGEYRLTLTPDVGDTFQTAKEVTVTLPNWTLQSSAIEIPGDVDVYRFTAPHTGGMTFWQFAAQDSTLDSVLTIFDSSEKQLTRNDDSLGYNFSTGAVSHDSVVRIEVNAGEDYYVQAGAFGDSTGAYDLYFFPDDFGDSIATAEALTLAATGAGSINGVIDSASDRDYFRFTAPVTGGMTLTLTDNDPSYDLDGYLAPYDGAGQLVAFNDDSPDGTNSRIQLNVTAGSTYYLLARAYSNRDGGGSRGGYVLNISTQSLLLTDDHGNTLPEATAVDVSPGFVRLYAQSETPGDVDWFRFTATASGSMTVSQNRTATSTVVPYLHILDETRTEIVNSYDSSIHDSARASTEVQFNVVAGQTYYVQAAGFRSGGAGGYDLTFLTDFALALESDDVGDQLASAPELSFAPDGSTVFQGTIGVPADRDLFHFVAQQSGLLTFRQSAAQGSYLDTELFLLDESGAALASNDDITEEADGDSQDDGSEIVNRDSQFGFEVIAGKTYYLQATGYGYSTGRYIMTIAPPDGGNTFAEAVNLQAGLGIHAGEIEVARDVDYYQLTPAQDGQVRVQLRSAAGSLLDTVLAAYDSDSNHTLLASNDDSNGTLNSVVLFNVSANHTYYLKAFGYDASTGAYELEIGYVSDGSAEQAGQQFSTAQLLTLNESGETSVTGAIAVAGEQDFYQFVAPFTGVLVMQQQQGTGSSLDSYLYAYNSAAILLASNDDASSTSRDSQISLNTVSGERYYLRAAGYGTSTGGYVLHFSGGHEDDFGNTFAEADELILNADGSGAQSGSIEVPQDSDYFRFVAPVTGTLIAHQEATIDSNLDSYLYVYAADQTLLASNDDGSAGLDSAVALVVESGSVYFIRASAYSASTGAYVLQLSMGTGTDDHGDDFASATFLDFSPDNTVVVGGQLEVAGDVDYFSFVAPFTGDLIIEEKRADAGFDSLLAVYNAAQELLEEHDGEAPDYLDSRIVLSVVAGETYYLRAAEYYDRAGPYTLRITLQGDDYGNDPATAHLVTLNDQDTGVIRGELETTEDVDYFRLVAPGSGTLEVQQNALPGHDLDSYLYVYDENQTLLASNDDAASGNRNSVVVITVTVGETYYIKADNYDDGSTGSYDLQLRLVDDDFGNTFAVAQLITLDAAGTGVQGGDIEVGADTDFFQFVAPLTGVIDIQQKRESGSDLDSYLHVYDGNRTLLESNDDAFSVLGDSEVGIPVTAGQIYYIQAGGFEDSTGPYSLHFAPGSDDFSNTFAGATPLTIHLRTVVEQPGTINYSRDSDVFQFTAAYTGGLQIQQSAGIGSSLDSYLTVYDAHGNEITHNDDYTSDILNSRLSIDVVAGQIYHVRAAGYRGSQGAYNLIFSDDHQDTFAGATVITLDPKLNAASAFGTINWTGDLDYFRFEATFSGPLRIRQEWSQGSHLDSYLFIFDDSQALIATNDNHGGLLDSEIIFNAVQGRTYHVVAGAAGVSGDPNQAATGRYRLNLAPVVDDLGNTLEEARTLLLDSTNSAQLSGTSESAGDVDVVQFVARTSGRIQVDLQAAQGSSLDTLLVVVAANGQELARNDDASGSRNSSLVLDVTPGQRYFLRMAGHGNSSGHYQLELTPTLGDDFGDDLGSAHVVNLSVTGTAHQAGVLERAGDRDLFCFVASQTGTATMTLATPASANLRVFNTGAGIPEQVASDSALPGVASFAVVAGEIYCVQVASTGTTVGDYQLNIALTAVSPADTDLEQTGKQVVFQLRDSFVQNAPGSGRSDAERQQAAQVIGQELWQAFIASQGGALTTDYLILWLDPVDFVVTDPGVRQVGHTSSQGNLREINNAFVSFNGVLDLLIIPNALRGLYTLEMVGVGSNQVLAGAQLIRQDGSLVAPGITVAGQGASSLTFGQVPRDGLQVVLDFRQPQSATTAPVSSSSGLVGLVSLPGQLSTLATTLTTLLNFSQTVSSITETLVLETLVSLGLNATLVGEVGGDLPGASATTVTAFTPEMLAKLQRDLNDLLRVGDALLNGTRTVTSELQRLWQGWLGSLVPLAEVLHLGGQLLPVATLQALSQSLNHLSSETMTGPPQGWLDLFRRTFNTSGSTQRPARISRKEVLSSPVNSVQLTAQPQDSRSDSSAALVPTQLEPWWANTVTLEEPPAWNTALTSQLVAALFASGAFLGSWWDWAPPAKRELERPALRRRESEEMRP